MADKGWISLYRQIQECWIWNDKPFAKGQAWIDLLLLANHRPAKIAIDGKPVTIERGQFHTSTIKLAERWGWDRRKVSRFLDGLESDLMLTQHRTPNGTTLTLVNYEVYQGNGTTLGTTDGTTLGTTDGTQTINKQLNNEINKDIKHKYGANNNVLLTDDEYKALQDKYPDYLTKIDDLSYYIASKKVSYKSHYMTILSWARKDEAKAKPKANNFNKFSQNEYDYEALERAMEGN